MAERPHDVKLADEAPIVRIAHTIIQQAIKDDASEVHVEPGADSVVVHFRITGALSEAMKLPGELHQDLIDRYKIMADMNIAERRIPQDGRIGITHQGKDYDLSVHSEPTPAGEKIIMSLRVRR